MADDIDIQQHIKDLIATEHELRDRLTKGEVSKEEEHAELKSVEIELDRCWDLLRQRRALREYGENPSDATLRGEGTVENYLG
jgi:predicted nuclease with TOPRIM domain